MVWRRRLKWCVGIAACLLCAPAGALAGEIETDFIQQPWAKQWVRYLEVGRYPVRWRQRASGKEGLFAGLRVTAPLGREAVWDLATDVSDLGKITPGVESVSILEDSPNRQVIRLDVRLLWKLFSLTFEIEKDSPEVIRFRLSDELIGEYRGVCTFDEVLEKNGDRFQQGRTRIEISTWLKPQRPLPGRLILALERMVLLPGVREFLELCEQQSQAESKKSEEEINAHPRFRPTSLRDAQSWPVCIGLNAYA